VDWVRKSFDGVGVTQFPPGRALPAVQERYVSHVVLCIDVSGSMCIREGAGTRLDAAKRGAERFISEAEQSYYRVGLILWHHDVAASEPLSRDTRRARALLESAVTSGGNNICPTLELAIGELAPLANDRVIAIFGDGDLGDPRRARDMAQRAVERGIRIIVRGLGDAAREMELIATEVDAAARVESAHGIESGIASMAKALGRSRNRN
jgi:Mg-chelatase subunit ChlD